VRDLRTTEARFDVSVGAGYPPTDRAEDRWTPARA